MATDSTPDTSDGAPEEGPAEEAASPGPPRPPRPGKRSKGSGRIPMPSPQSRMRPGLVEPDAIVTDPADSAPAFDVNFDSGPPAFPRVGHAAQPVSVPEESFADLDADLQERAPNAPFTPWRGVPALQAEPVDITPARGTPINFGTDDDSESEPEPTIVGKVPNDLIELSAGGGGEENTRAFTAPRELIELAKRKREEGYLPSAAPPGTAHERATARPPAGIGAHEVERSRAAPSVPIDSVLPIDIDSDAAPPVARTVSGEMEAVALPSRKRPPESEPPEPSGPDIEIDPGSELSPSAYRAVVGANSKLTSPVSLPSSEMPKPASKRRWLWLAALFVVLGVVLARWQELVALFR